MQSHVITRHHSQVKVYVALLAQTSHEANGFHMLPDVRYFEYYFHRQTHILPNSERGVVLPGKLEKFKLIQSTSSFLSSKHRIDLDLQKLNVRNHFAKRRNKYGLPQWLKRNLILIYEISNLL